MNSMLDNVKSVLDSVNYC